jgi:CDP-diacylglycerol--glycerol-3-phosphate 3-phosphatidyltransferase
MLPASPQSDYSEPAIVLESVSAPRPHYSNEIWNLPNALTLFRIFLVPFLVVVLLTKFAGREYAGLAIFLVAAVTDFFDGYVARRYNKMTKLGALLDPMADKLLMSAAFISLVELNLARAWMIVIIIGREFAVDSLRAIAAQQGVTIAASPLGKTKTVSQVIAVSLLILSYELGEYKFVAELSLWVVMLFALVSAVDYFIKFSRAVFFGQPSNNL